MSEVIYSGKTKDIYQGAEENQLVLKFKDDVTGVDGVFDPGANQVGLSIEGVGQVGLRLTKYFYSKLNEAGYPTHFVDADIENNTMTVRKAQVFGKGLEVITRFKATGSFVRRYGDYVTEGTPLNAYVEVTLKDDDREDPYITKDALALLDIMNGDQYEELVATTKEIASFVRDDIAAHGLEVFDIKLEFGFDAVTGKVILIDEISGGNMRVFDNGEYVLPLNLINYFPEA
ncbi:phosphoribosylaminoimidazolesuccinocarboxamide synthase [Aerococcus agrisoli]|uniref:phosphoribosylaminoimidazolesuccinocarboxamide synthase n=1 Tax=Aerococcus agrisoli TaxID=2487350 RepID=A0A3N4GX39_9LACT|nr:phosphoribosylaminoimidazolesuccinocarboxamide synthase [Aerococcus agrisoli]RPA63651.1 phosphoribosylaminoimidazolesuccinocarboxamide synthase [Aerococcus agrisoli]